MAKNDLEKAEVRQRLSVIFGQRSRQLYTISKKWCRGYHVGRAYDAEDLLGSVFVDVCRRINKDDIEVDLNDKFTAYLAISLRGKAKKISRRRESSVINLAESSALIADLSADPASTAEHSETWQLLNSAIENLDAAEKTLIELRIQEVGWQAIATQLNVDESTVRYRYARAIKKIIGILGGPK